MKQKKDIMIYKRDNILHTQTLNFLGALDIFSFDKINLETCSRVKPVT